ncbi:MAG: hypothetical protein MI784_06835 [Cytophagales bacterium]|nr:hypothetical protein [Cytophagales bacterium]
MAKEQKCFYSGKKANGSPVKVKLFKGKNTHKRTRFGFSEHYETASVQIPRSRYAENVHWAAAGLKWAALAGCLMLEGSIFWNVLIGLGLASLALYIALWALGVKPKHAYQYDLPFYLECLFFLSPALLQTEYQGEVPYLSNQGLALQLFIGLIASSLLHQMMPRKPVFLKKGIPSSVQAKLGQSFQIGTSPLLSYVIPFLEKLKKFMS